MCASLACLLKGLHLERILCPNYFLHSKDRNPEVPIKPPNRLLKSSPLLPVLLNQLHLIFRKFLTFLKTQVNYFVLISPFSALVPPQQPLT